MGITVVPEKILRLMSPADRAPLGKAGMTAKEAQSVKDSRVERELQKDMVNLLEQREIFYWQSRMDKKTTTRKGMPDFLVVLRGGKALAVEAKVHGGELSEDQKRVFTAYWTKTGGVVHIVWSLEQFKALLDQAAA